MTALMERANLFNDDCIKILKQLPSNSLDSMITDPPAGIDFMGKGWDSDHGGRDHWINWLSVVMREAMRVLKPGAHGLVWAIPRTSHWTACALENSGFEIRDIVHHLFGSGFPKGQNIAKQMDKELGAVRPIVGQQKLTGTARVVGTRGHINKEKDYADSKLRTSTPITTAASATAKQWEGWGTALKPATEHWILVRKPMTETIAANVRKYGTGGINIDGTRIGTTERFNASSGSTTLFKGFAEGEESGRTAIGRYPANLVLSHHAECQKVGTKKVGQGKKVLNSEVKRKYNDQPTTYSKRDVNVTDSPTNYGEETVTKYNCHRDCPVLQLDQQSGSSKSSVAAMNLPDPGHFFKPEEYAKSGKPSPVAGKTVRGFDDEGGASRFFHVEEAPSEEDIKGRYPANLVLSHHEECKEVGTKRVKTSMGVRGRSQSDMDGQGFYAGRGEVGQTVGYADADGMETVAAYECVPTCPIRLLDEQSGTSKSVKIEGGATRKAQTETTTNPSGWTESNRTKKTEGYSDEGGASRFFYCAKVSSSDKNEGLEGMPIGQTKGGGGMADAKLGAAYGSIKAAGQNFHPTVKNTKLMSYLIKLITPPNGIILDPFMGSGTTGVAAIKDGYRFCGMEWKKQYFEIASKRIEAAKAHLRETLRAKRGAVIPQAKRPQEKRV